MSVSLPRDYRFSLHVPQSPVPSPNLAFPEWWYDEDSGDGDDHPRDDSGCCLSRSDWVPGTVFVIPMRAISFNLPRLHQGRNELPHFTDEETETCSHPVAAFRLGLRGL